MNRRLGISIYPEHSTVERDTAYIKRAAECGFERVFTCLLSAQKPIDVIREEFTETISVARNLGMDVILDIAPAVFSGLGISYDDLSFFAELGASGIRLDLGFDGLRESQFTYNQYDLDIEINMSNNTNYVNNIFSHNPKQTKLLGCHNFYPQRFTGLDFDFFIACSQRFKDLGLRTAAFVSSSAATIGPWDVNDGLCTLEEHRELPITTQAKHLWATNLIDDVIIGNAYASDEELVALGALNRYVLEFEVEVEAGTSAIERKIIFEEPHIRRGDISSYMIRSTPSRTKYKDEQFPVRPVDAHTCGDVMIGNDNFGKYKGELQLILKTMPIDDRKNLVARVVEHERFLIPYIGAWNTLAFKEKTN